MLSGTAPSARSHRLPKTESRFYFFLASALRRIPFSSKSSHVTDPTASPDAPDDPRLGPRAAALSHHFLRAVRMAGDTDHWEATLAELSRADLMPVLRERGPGLAFWINVYNAATQLRLRRDGDSFGDRSRFFGTPCLTVAGTRLSLDDMEHGILRGGRPKLGLGFIPGIFSRPPFPGLRLPLDPRIHFALNCGAASCPPIAAYTTSGIDGELDLATRSYLEQEVDYDPERRAVTLPRICLWYMGDFGGFPGLRTLLREHGVIPTQHSPSIRFSSYDWRATPGSFTDLHGEGQNSG